MWEGKEMEGGWGQTQMTISLYSCNLIVGRQTMREQQTPEVTLNSDQAAWVAGDSISEKINTQ